ncbi:MAG: uracil phosphoribosyltransferase [Candidatus Shapirobacteria bacterium]|nr:uracil phosphoribosyltransferase [Candidatus Shapirobacteria bacterium]
MNRVEFIESNFIKHHLSYLRSQNTPPTEFRQHSDAIFEYLGSKLHDFFPTTTKKITTPLTEMEAGFTDIGRTLLVAILRSGYPMCSGIQKSFDQAPIALVDIKRDEATAQPHLNYDGLPKSLKDYDSIIIPDPMLATGGSACMSLDMLKKRGAKNIIYVSLISAPTGINKILSDFPDVKLIVCAADPEINEKKYIVPGLGDFGDRYFGNEPLSIYDELQNQTIVYQPNGKFTLKK